MAPRRVQLRRQRGAPHNSHSENRCVRERLSTQRTAAATTALPPRRANLNAARSAVTSLKNNYNRKINLKDKAALSTPPGPPAGNLASKVWASVRVATRLLAWRVRVRARAFSVWSSALDHYVERAASLGTRKAVRVTEISNHSRAGPFGAPLRAVVALPILVGRLLVQQWPSNRQLPRRPRRRAAPPPATQLAEQYKGVGGHFVGRFCAHLSATTKLVCPFLPIAWLAARCDSTKASLTVLHYISYSRRARRHLVSKPACCAPVNHMPDGDARVRSAQRAFARTTRG